MVRVVFVCQGNICRSPLAELVLGRMLEEAGRDDVEVLSAGVTAEVGAGMDPGSLACAGRRELDGSAHVAEQFEVAQLRAGDVVVVLDRWAGRQVSMLTRWSRSSVRVMVEPVVNPWRCPTIVHERAYQSIREVCVGLLEGVLAPASV